MAITLKPLRDQTIVVTGATSGNGLAIVEDAVRRGASVVATARNEAALEALRDRLSADGGRIAICVADVSDMAAVERVAAVAIEAFGGFRRAARIAGRGAASAPTRWRHNQRRVDPWRPRDPRAGAVLRDKARGPGADRYPADGA
jgi:NAD(P)-dependent dehydrogenase (short-subunit alcohol dehydrogenase family)